MIQDYQICNGIIDCISEYHDESSCEKQRFSCMSKNNEINIPLDQVCDGEINCIDKSDEPTEGCPDRFRCSSNNGSKVRLDVLLLQFG